MGKKKLFFAVFEQKPRPRIVVSERDAELSGNFYGFERVAGVRSRISVDEIGTILDNDFAVGENEEQALSLLRGQLQGRAEKLERKAKRLRFFSNMQFDRE